MLEDNLNVIRSPIALVINQASIRWLSRRSTNEFCSVSNHKVQARWPPPAQSDGFGFGV